MSGILWKAHKKNGLTMVYGFKTKERFYDVVLSLYRKGETTTVYGFLSKVTIEPDDFWSLWDKLKEVVETEYIVFEVLPEHAIVYKQFLPVLEVVSTKTFNGYESELLKIRIDRAKS
jgi:hypothetical protein